VLSTKIELIGFDSVGIRSMATFIETDDVTVFIDPSVSIAPLRFSLPPHPIELKRLEEVAEIICRRAFESDIIVVTHYHYDHHDLGVHIPLDIYKGKLVVIKNPTEKINFSQRLRARKFLSKIENLVKELRIGDNTSFTVGKTLLKFSPPTPHGPTTNLGYVIQVFISDEDSSFLHTSDVEGPVNEDALDFMRKNPAKTVVVDGPPTYLSGVKQHVSDVRIALKNIVEFLNSVRPEHLIIDHHLLRDVNYRLFYDEVRKHVGNVNVITAAEFMGREPELLEALRRDLYGIQGR